MSFWWVNHKQTFTSEISGGYIWSPQRKSNGGFNQAYENLRLVKPGDTVFSYADGQIKAIGVATSTYRDEVKPEDFGKAGDAWHLDGWLVPIEWAMLEYPLRPKNHLDQIVPELPERYSPLQGNGNGNQGVYLAKISSNLGRIVLALAGAGNHHALTLVEEQAAEVEENQAQAQLVDAGNLASTEIEQLVKARRGQGIYRINLQKLEKRCRLTHLADPQLLVASHIKPWKDSTNEERLDGHNGLLLSPHVDRLFDRGHISFADDGSIIAASPKVVAAMSSWGLSLLANAGAFTAKQKNYLAYHREKVLKK